MPAATPAIAPDGAAPSAASPSRPRIAWIDAVKGLALLWIVWNHYAEQIWRPAGAWPPIREQVARLAHADLGAVAELLVRFARGLGDWGDYAVSLFVVLSGLGLALGRARSTAAPSGWGDFYRRRIVRLYPMWIGAHVALLGLELLGLVRPTGRLDFLLSAAGVRVLPTNYFLGAPAWWYFGLQFQLYVVFPLVWMAHERLGRARFLAAACALGFSARALGMMLLSSYRYPWLLGVVFVTRLPCFALGVVLGSWIAAEPRQVARLQRSPAVLAGAALVVLLTYRVIARAAWGPVFEPFSMALGLFPLAVAVADALQRSRSRLGALVAWVGVHSYSIFLVHHVVLLIVLPHDARQTVARALAVAVLVAPLSVALERAVDQAERLLATVRTRTGARRLAGALALSAVVGVGCAIALDAAVRRFAPQEVNGWGERAALEPHARWGWRLRPSAVTRLRWRSYDYVVTSNSLGLPGPEPRAAKAPGGLRVMTIGDAFTSAEGVDTARAWPRLLEALLARKLGRDVEVLNVAVTGWGPRQYAAAVEDVAPRFRPDIAVVGFFVNDPADVAMDQQAVVRAIGFGSPDPDALRERVRARHLRQFVEVELLTPVREWISGEPSEDRLFLSGVGFLDARGSAFRPELMAEVETELRRVRQLAAPYGGAVLLSIPAPAQVCAEAQLPLFPHGVDLGDGTRWDRDLPQRAIEPVARRAGFAYEDLRAPLRAAGASCPYQRRNLHFTEAGHRLVAEHVAERWFDLVDAARAALVPAPPAGLAR